MQSLSAPFAGPLFLCGGIRSGTTYVLRLINQLPDVRLRYESTMLRYGHQLFAAEQTSILRNRDAFERFLDRLAEQERLHGYDPSPVVSQSAEFYEDLYTEFRRHQSYTRFCYQLFSADITPSRIWGNKLASVEEFELMQKVFPQARFVVTIRDPRSVAHSIRERSGANRLLTALDWARLGRGLQDVLDSWKARHSVLVVRYEDVVASPRDTIARIADFLDLAPLPADSPVAAPRLDRVAAWRTQLAQADIREIEELCFDEMQAFHYVPEEAETARGLSPMQLRYAVCSNAWSRFRRNVGQRINQTVQGTLTKLLPPA